MKLSNAKLDEIDEKLDQVQIAWEALYEKLYELEQVTDLELDMSTDWSCLTLEKLVKLMEAQY